MTETAAETTESDQILDTKALVKIVKDQANLPTSNSGDKNCMDVSHANVTITLVESNTLSCGIQGYGALVKDGIDDTELTIQCEYVSKKEHQCMEGTCGSLNAKGTVTHATAIGNITRNRTIADESGFLNLTIKGGIIRAKAGAHNCAIGSACGSESSGGGSGVTSSYFDISNIIISGGNTLVRAAGHKDSDMPGIGCGKEDSITGQEKM